MFLPPRQISKLTCVAGAKTYDTRRDSVIFKNARFEGRDRFCRRSLLNERHKRFTNPSVGLLEGKGTVSPTELARREPPTEETAIVDRSQSGVRLRHVWFVSP